MLFREKDIKVGDRFHVTDDDGDVHEVKVMEIIRYRKSSTILLRIQYTSSTYYTVGAFEDFELDDWLFWLNGGEGLIINRVDRMEDTDLIKLTPALRAIFIDLALATKDREWFHSLTSKEAVI